MNANAIIGSVIRESRKRKGINQETLCQGLCSRTLFARVETGQRECEKILMDAFLQRAGVASDRFCYIADPEEQVVLICREKMYDAIEQNDVARAESFFAEYAKLTKDKSKLHRQLLLYYRAVLGWKNERPMDEIKAMLDEAWEISHPGEAMFGNDGKVMSMTELSIAMMWARVTEDGGDTEAAKDCYESLQRYMENLFDRWSVGKIYPQVAYRLTNIYLQGGETGKALALALRVVKLLREQARMNYMRFFLSIIEQYGSLSPSERNFVEQACAGIRWLYERFGVEEWCWEWDESFSMNEYSLCGEIIRARREALGMSQEELAEGICDPVTISRIECGHVAPKRKIFEALMQKVGMTGCGYDTYLPMRSLEVWKCATEINRLLNQARAQEALPLIEQLERLLEKPSKHERQFILHVKSMALGNMGKISLEQRRDMQAEALHLTMPESLSSDYNKWYFSAGEMSCALAYAFAEDRCGNSEKRKNCINLLYSINRQLDGRKCYAPKYEACCCRLGDVLGNAHKYQEGIAVEYDGIRAALEGGLGAILGSTLYDCGWNMEQLWQCGAYTADESLRYVRTSFLLDTLYENNIGRDFVKEHIKNQYQMEV